MAARPSIFSGRSGAKSSRMKFRSDSVNVSSPAASRRTNSKLASATSTQRMTSGAAAGRAFGRGPAGGRAGPPTGSAGGGTVSAGAAANRSEKL